MIKLLLVSSVVLSTLNPTSVLSMNAEYSNDTEVKKTKKRKFSSEREEQKRKRKVDSISDKKSETKAIQNVCNKEDVTLIAGKGSKESGGGAGGHYWNIFCQDKRAGKVFINFIDEKPIGKHASLQIFLNKSSQGRHIGRYAYEMACEQSQYDKVYAHMSKKNIASRKAAEAAGFLDFSSNEARQTIMKWEREKSKK